MGDRHLWRYARRNPDFTFKEIDWVNDARHIAQNERVVSVNNAISRMFKDMVISSLHLTAMHKDVPNGDGGISVGQAAIALRRIQ